MVPVNSLQQLLELLPSCSGKDYVKIARNMSIPLSDFSQYAHWKKDSYTRNCIARTNEFELLLLCWDSFVKTPVHCHGNQECWVYTVDGHLVERRYLQNEDESLKQVHANQMSPSTISYMNDNMGFHDIENVSEKRAMTLHLYVSPIDECNVYNPSTHSFEQKKMSYHTLEGTPVGLEHQNA